MMPLRRTHHAVRLTAAVFAAALLALPVAASARHEPLVTRPLHSRASAASTVPEPGVSRRLNAVTCSTAGNCWAVGSYVTVTGVSHTEVLHWTGSGWHLMNAPTPTGGAFLTGITCSGPNSCVAVGGTGNYMERPQVNFALVWNGQSWKVESTPNQNCLASGCSVRFLQAVSCAAPGRCLAVGKAIDTDVIFNTGMVRDANGWHMASPRWNTFGGDAVQGINSLNGVSCNSASSCWAVGNSGFGGSKSGGANETFQWTGEKWRKGSAPSPGNTKTYGSGPSLQAVACASRNECWAAGFVYSPNGQKRDQILGWTGSGWNVAFVGPGGMSPPAPGDWSLAGASCVSSTDCWAVGDSPKGNQIVRMDRQGWRLRAAPNPSGIPVASTHLTGIACTTAGRCWAVGYFK